jgi:hypothetical protein
LRGHGGAPTRIATSIPSRAKSTGACEADRRTSIFGCRALNAYRRGISHRIMNVATQDTTNAPSRGEVATSAVLASRR